MLYRNASQTVSNGARNRCSLLTSKGHERTSAVRKTTIKVSQGCDQGPEVALKPRLFVLKLERDFFTVAG